MQSRHLQMLMAAAGFYTGGIDGILGPISKAAMAAVEARHASDYKFDPKTTFDSRRETGAAQACLKQLGHDPGIIDGWDGVHTEEALNAFLFKQTNGHDESIPRTPTGTVTATGDIPFQRDVGTYYGAPGDGIKSQLVIIDLPFSLRIDWNLRQKVSRISVHKRASAQLKKALIEVHDHYGMTRMQELGIDRYAGCYNHRKMRGSNSWSMHAYGCAIDFYAEPNGLRTKCPDALFCGAEYKDFLDIMEANEWLPAIRLWGKDAMHFQRAKL